MDRNEMLTPSSRAGLLFFGSCVIYGQTAGKPAFDVASVKASAANGPRDRGLGSIRYSPDTVTMRGVSMWLIVRWAYGVGSYQMSGPSSMQDPPYYDIVAKTHGPVPESQLRLMLRALLAERFHLAVRLERKEMPVTALLVAKGGPKFQESAGKFDTWRGPEAPMQFFGFDEDVRIQRSLAPNGSLQDSFTNMPMEHFAAVLELMGSRSPYDKLPVVNMTGLQGRYDFVVVLDAPGGGRVEGGDASPPDDPLAAYKRILPSELGLTLESRKATVEVLVIDHADKTPTEN